MNDQENTWCIYLIRTRLNSLYCGITNNVERRFAQHQTGKGAKYLRGKGPLTLVWHRDVESKSIALKYEYQIKKMTKASKEALVIHQHALPLIND